LPAHHNAVSAGESPLGGFLLDRPRLNSEGVMIRLRIALDFWWSMIFSENRLPLFGIKL
jgi:hypothetical protein